MNPQCSNLLVSHLKFLKDIKINPGSYFFGRKTFKKVCQIQASNGNSCGFLFVIVNKANLIILFRFSIKIWMSLCICNLKKKKRLIRLGIRPKQRSKQTHNFSFLPSRITVKRKKLFVYAKRTERLSRTQL
jgi:hypothetical protein